MYFMRMVFVVLFLFSVRNTVFAQYVEQEEVKYFSKDQILIDINYNYLLDEEQLMGQTWNSFGSGVYLYFNLLGKNSNICIASGFGINMLNYRTGTQPVDSSGHTLFQKIPSTIEYKKNKVALTYFEIPLEIRIRTNPNDNKRSIKFFLGAKIGYLINDHLKYVGEDFNTGSWVKYKSYYIPNISKINYGLTSKMGYGRITMSAYYSLVSLFNSENTVEISPLNIGISIFVF